MLPLVLLIIVGHLHLLNAQAQGPYPNPNDPKFSGRWDNWPYVPPTNNPLFPKQFELEMLSRTVETTKGKVVGALVKLHDGPGREWDKRFLHTQQVTPWQDWLNVTVFLGIPYAEPPLGDLRFRPPREKAGWRPSARWATRYGPVCPQPKKWINVVENQFEISEDCLYLNVFTPNLTSQIFPVMVFIHGGGFFWGASNIYPGHILAASQGVVVVTLNYRLGPLGFLSTGDEHSPGNYGILDQRMALDWVRTNIHAFRGDHTRITIFGQSAGGASVGLHTLSPRSKGLFRAAIAQSGSELAPWAVISHWEQAWNNSKKFGEFVGCPIHSSERLVDCLRSGKSALELGDAAEYKPDIGLFGWAPVVDIPPYRGILAPDQQFLPNKPDMLLQTGFYDPTMPFLSGVTEDEGYSWLHNNPKVVQNNFMVTQPDMDDAIRELLKTENYTINAFAVEESVRFMYTHWPDPMNATMRRKQFVNMYSDIYYKAPAYKSLNQRAALGAQVYQYVLNYSKEESRERTSPDFHHGFVPHMEDLYWVFGFPFLDNDRHNMLGDGIVPRTFRRKWTSQGDRNMSDFMMQLWGNFAKYHNPTPWRVCNTTWEKFTLLRDAYVVLNQTNTSYIYESYRSRESAFWTNYLPSAFFPTTPAPWPTETPIEMERRHYMIATWITVTLGGVILLTLIVVCCLYVRQKKDVDEMDF